MLYLATNKKTKETKICTYHAGLGMYQLAYGSSIMFRQREWDFDKIPEEAFSEMLSVSEEDYTLLQHAKRLDTQLDKVGLKLGSLKHITEARVTVSGGYDPPKLELEVYLNNE